MKTVAVYKTDVDERSKAKTIVKVIRQQLPDCDVNFDLDDCDNVLRVECRNVRIDKEQIKEIVRSAGFQIEKLL